MVFEQYVKSRYLIVNYIFVTRKNISLFLLFFSQEPFTILLERTGIWRDLNEIFQKKIVKYSHYPAAPIQLATPLHICFL